MIIVQDLYCVRSDLGNLLKALGRLDEAKVMSHAARSISTSVAEIHKPVSLMIETTSSVSYALIRIFMNCFNVISNGNAVTHKIILPRFTLKIRKHHLCIVDNKLCPFHTAENKCDVFKSWGEYTRQQLNVLI